MRLRAEGGCPWDREQTHASLRPNLIEEAYEAVEAVDRGLDERRLVGAGRGARRPDDEPAPARPDRRRGRASSGSRTSCGRSTPSWSAATRTCSATRSSATPTRSCATGTASSGPRRAAAPTRAASARCRPACRRWRARRRSGAGPAGPGSSGRASTAPGRSWTRSWPSCGRPRPTQERDEELGDVLWMVTTLASYLGRRRRGVAAPGRAEVRAPLPGDGAARGRPRRRLRGARRRAPARALAAGEGCRVGLTSRS